MSYCPECGSEVANNDVFCAYCGISLQVIAPPVSETPQPENTPKMGEPEKIQTSATLDKEPIKSIEIEDTKVEEPTPMTPPTPFILEENEDAKISETDENKNVEDVFQPSSFDTPIETTKTAEQIIERTADYDLSPEEPGEIIAETPVISEPVDEPPSQLNSPLETNDQETIKTAEQYPEIQNTEPAPVSEAVDEFSQTIPYSPADYSNQDLVAPKAVEPQPVNLQGDEEDRLKSVLDEIDNNLQIQNSFSSENFPVEEKPFENALSEPITEDASNPQFAQEIPVVEEFQANKPVEQPMGEATAVEEPSKIEESFEKEEPVSTTIPESPISAELPKASESVGFESSSVSETFEETPMPEAIGEVPVLEEIGTSEPPINEAIQDIPVSQEVPVVSETPVLAENSQDAAIAVEEKPIEPLSFSDDLAEKEGRSFTNPNIGYGDTDGRSKQKLKPLEEGTVLNKRYEIIRKIGGGGMGAVYLANDKNLGGVLRAVKEMVQSYIEDEQQEKAVNDFKRESLLLTSLEHPGIPTIYDYFFDEKEGRFYLVMKYISGGDLAARLRAAPEGRIDEVSVTDWAIQIADVLDYLHNRQPPIVYRDLKPSNIMIDGNTGKLMIIDFGIARWVNKEEKGVTAVGTMGYAPPELFSGNVEPRSDIYSLGSTMFHLLTGADPQSNPLLIFDFNKNPRPRQINPSLSDQMEQILMRSVEYNSEQRFNSAAQMRNELNKHLENLKKGTVTFGIISSVGAGQSPSSVPVFCGFCGQKIVATDLFCPFCGAQQPLVGQSQKLAPTPPAYIAPMVTARLVIVGTSDLERTEYTLEKDNNLLGRRDPMSNIFPEVDMSKFDPQTKISRKHARIWREGDRFMLEDLGSSNGTILIMNNNETIRLLPRQPHVISHGDQLRLGDTTLRFTVV